MKAVVFLLVLANLLFYAFSAGYFGHPDNPDAGRVDRQVAPDRMRIVSRGEAPAVAVRKEPPAVEAKPVEELAPVAKAEPEKPVEPEVKVEKAQVCLSWRPLPAADAERLSALLGKRFAEFKQSRKTQASEGSNGWWVHIPPLPSKAEADKKAGELRELGISDFFVVQDGVARFAISLGVFSSEKGGQDRLTDLKSKGVRSAVLAPRPGKDAMVTLQARGPAADKAAILAAVGQILPKSDALLCK